MERTKGGFEDVFEVEEEGPATGIADEIRR